VPRQGDTKGVSRLPKRLNAIYGMGGAKGLPVKEVSPLPR
jgi:hypothetical protein